MSRILVTGAGGFIGRRLCDHLGTAGYRVRGTFRSPPVTGAPRVPGEMVFLDLERRAADLDALLGEVDTVVHLAAHVHVGWPRALRWRVFRRINTEATAHLAGAAARCGVRRFIFLSSAGVHGSTSMESGGQPRRIRESDPLQPHNAYTRSKLEAERALASVCRSSRMEFVILRAPLVFGPGVGSSFLRLLKAVDREIPMPLRGVCAQRSLVYVGNLVRLIERCIRSRAVAGQIFLLSDFDVGIAELVSRLGALLERRVRHWACPSWALAAGTHVPVIGGVVSSLTSSFLVDGSRIRATLDWWPSTELDSALYATTSWYLGAAR